MRDDLCVGRAQRARQAPRGFWRADGAERRRRAAAFTRDVARERAQRRQSALQRPPLDALRPPPREKGAQILSRAGGGIGDRRRRAVPLGQERQELTRIAGISLDREQRHSPLRRKTAKPRGDRRREVGRGGEGKEIGRRHGNAVAGMA